MRLTEKTINGSYDLTQTAKEDLKQSLYTQVEQKLDQLEDIEDELGIDLIILFKAIRNGFYDNEGNYYQSYDYSIDIEGNCLRETFEDYMNSKSFYFQDYGKTWVLTKEELE